MELYTISHSQSRERVRVGGKTSLFLAKSIPNPLFLPISTIPPGCTRNLPWEPLLPFLPCYNVGLHSSCTNQITPFPGPAPLADLPLASHHTQEETKLLPLSCKALPELSLSSSLATPPCVTVFQLYCPYFH